MVFANLKDIFLNAITNIVLHPRVEIINIPEDHKTITKGD
ncbi:hypothetical protein Cpin_7302 [Chitinophaga pinensis DSM 2588]|uniref:Uncharacterized protein n=1 Tax=Chitinophaga pinensis (strain ATCC 43595 / DSM 2588 / LMG 13176 / NBRC 15968 / NCIMB 11800 / UQM 2034) TaxID=485918 RepID=A0A979H0C7_CHIPD|nr:hypothetical protein Cpin_7302 [Chitinophaga pinensis DSM 2588]